MQHIIIWCIRFRGIRFVLTSCLVFMFVYAIKVTNEDYVKIKQHIKSDDYMVETSEEISCYYRDDIQLFPSTEDPTFSPKAQSMFFIESACKEKMTMLQACVIESAAIAHPEMKIYVLISYSITETLIKGYFEQVLKYPNVSAARVHIAQHVKGTALEPILVNDIKKSKYPTIEDVKNILKITTLHKWGGTVLSNDMLVIRALEDLPKNWVVKQNSGLSSGILSFAKDDVGKNITSEIIKELAQTYDPKSRYYNHLETILNRVLKRRCPDLFTSKSGECNGFKVFPEDFFYPIRIPSPAPYLDDSTESIEVVIPYTYHIKNMDYSSYPSEEWPSESLARIFCPRTYEFRLKIN